MAWKVCHSCNIAIEVEVKNEAQWNFCNVCGKGLELIPDEEIGENYEIFEE